MIDKYNFKNDRTYSPKNAQNRGDQFSELDKFYYPKKKEETVSLNEKINKKTRECLMVSTTHGIPKLAVSRFWYLKLLWAMSLLAALGYCIYCINKTLVSYFDYSVITQLSVQNKPLIEFPTVTFCNNNPFNTETDYFILKPYFVEMYRYYTQEYIIHFREIQDLIRFMDYLTKTSEFSAGITDFHRYLFSFSLEEMLISCHFNNKPCSRDDFEYFFSFTYGNCFKFNSGKNYHGNKSRPIKSVFNSGKKNGLRLELFVGHPVLMSNYYRSPGAHIFVHNSSILPLTEIEGISVATGFETDVVINQVNFNKLPYPHSDCIVDVTSTDSFDSFLYKSTVRLTKTYRQKYCFQLCYQKYLEERCSCYDAALPFFTPNTSRPCDDYDALLCGYGVYANFSSTPDASLCFNDCPLECNSIQYNLASSSYEYPSKNYADLLINYLNYSSQINRGLDSIEKLKKSTLAVNVFYNDISYLEVNEVPSASLNKLIGDIGGYLGLCLGSSILSLGEIFELLLEIFFTWWNN